MNAARWGTDRPGPDGVAPSCFWTLKPCPCTADSCFEMTTIRTTCPRCGEVDMGPEEIMLSVRENGREGAYRFTCPSCADDVEKRADRKIVALLVWQAWTSTERPWRRRTRS